MKRNVPWRKKRPSVLAVLLNLVLFGAVIFLMGYVQQLLHADVQVNLNEIVTQNKNVITSKLKLELNNLSLAAEQITIYLKQTGDINEASLKQAVARYSDESGDAQTYVSDGLGNGYFSDGTVLSIAGRRYFILAMQGEQNISQRLISRTTGDEIFVISAPFYVDDIPVGTVQRFYSPQEMYDLCSISLFSDQGYMYIINRDGYVQISTQDLTYSQENDNYYWSLFSLGNQEASRKLEADIKAGQAGFMETTVAGEQIFSAYTPLDDIHDWYLITSVSTNAVSRNANIVVRMFYAILFLVVLVFGSSLLYFFRYKNKQQAVLSDIAFVDTVTGGNTFNKFCVDLSRTLAVPNLPGCHLISFDIDNFKYVNSFYGFDMGDTLLRHIYQNISKNLMPGETMARVTDDHFVLLVTDNSPARLESLIPSKVELDGVAAYLSAGMYTITDPKENVSLMVDKASTASKSVKGTLRKLVVAHSDTFDETVAHNEHVKRELDAALTNREIIPFFQPKIDINTGKITGAEALARWRKADGSLISPADFIPLCEKTGQVMDLDLAIFRQVLEFLQRNLEKGVACVPISVNFSRLHLLQEDFIHTIINMLDEHAVPHNLIEIELTESVIFDNHEAIVKFVKHLHDHGLLICMDDFGSGYSSLNLLKDIPIDVLKIDKGFLDETDNMDRRQIILSAIIDMALHLRAQIVMEGVETKENVSMMKELGCSIAQGFFYARPMDETAFQTFFEKGVTPL